MAKTPPPLPSDVARHAGAVAVAAGPAQPQAAPFKHRKAILTALDVEVPREDPPAGYGFGRRAPAYGPSSPTFPRTSP
jgi:hypothetical protein